MSLKVSIIINGEFVINSKVKFILTETTVRNTNFNSIKFCISESYTIVFKLEPYKKGLHILACSQFVSFLVSKGVKHMIVHVYALCWNEEKMLPFFFKHYDNIADQYYIFDNDSTDDSLSMLRENPKVVIDKFEVTGNSLVLAGLDQFNHFWKKSRGKADWVIVCEVDEHIYHPNLRKYLEECTAKGITLIVPSGYEMFSEFFPNSDRPLYQTVRNGIKSYMMDKPQIFNPNAIQEINFSPGRHNASPIGNVIKPPNNEVLLLHYKVLGYDYVNARQSALRQGLREVDIANGWGIQYTFDEKTKLEQFEKFKDEATKVL